MNNLTPITREEMLLNDEPLTPITREEKILAGEDLNPVTRREYFLKKYRHAGSDVMVEGLEVTANGTYTAPEGKAYSPVEVAVPLPDNAYLLKEASGSLVSFSDGADLPMPSFICKIEAVQSGSGDPSPENVRPISGHTGVDAWVRGKNLLPMTVNGIKAVNTIGTWSGNSYTVYGVTFIILTDSDNNVIGIKATGTASDTAILKFIGNVSYNEDVKVSGCPANGSGNSYFIFIGNVGYDFGNGMTIPANANVSVIRIQIANGYACPTSGLLFKPMVRLSSIVDDTFAPYNPNSQTIQVSWQTEAGEVFGGYVDLVSGVLTVDRVSVVYEGGNDEAWTMSTGGSDDTSWHQFYTPRTSAKNSLNAICNRFPTKDIAYRGTESLLVAYTDKTFKIALKDSDLLITSVDDWKTWLSTNNVQIVYELATPITYQLTPTQIKSLLGNNNAWCDTGDVDIDYFAKEVTG